MAITVDSPRSIVLPALFAVFFAAPASHAEAPLFRGDPAHSGTYQSTRVGTLTHVEWKFKTGAKVISSPAVVGRTVYVGSADHFVYALDAGDGSVRWRYKTGGAVNSSPAFANDTVFVLSADGNFYALDAKGGSLKWKFRTGGERRFTAPGIHGAMPRMELMPDPFDVFLSSPTVVDGVVYFGSGDHRVYALDASSGMLRWSFETGNVVHASPAVADGMLYIGSWDRNLYALKAATGEVAWKFQTGDDPDIFNQIGIASSASIAGDTVFFGCRDGYFYALDARTGAKKWAHDNHKGWVIASPAVADGIVYFPTSDGTRFKALDAATGSTRYDVGNKAVSFSSPALVKDLVLYGTSDGWLHAIDASTGKSHADFQTDGSKENSAKYLDASGRIDDRTLYPDATLDGMIVGLERMYTLGSSCPRPSWLMAWCISAAGTGSSTRSDSERGRSRMYETG